jgi:GNAT superfamily N-acetyltransferase
MNDGMPEYGITGYRLRTATRADVDAIVDMDRAHMKAEVEKHYRWDEENARKIVVENLDRARVLMFKRQMVGGYYWWIEKPDIAVLHSIQVAAAHRNKGLGKWLMACFENEAFAAGLKRAGLAVFTGNSARAFYERLGYKVTGNDGPNAVEMEKRLANQAVHAIGASAPHRTRLSGPGHEAGHGSDSTKL